MYEFTIKPGGVKDLGKKMIIRMIILFTFLIVIVAFINGGNQEGENVNTLPYLLVLFIGILGFTGYNTARRQKRMLESYKLIISEDRITREMLNNPSITIPKHQVREIIKSANGTFAIIGDSKLNAIGVPAPVNNRELLEQLLNEIKPVTIKTSQAWLQYLWIIAFPLVGLLLFAFASENIIISSVGGITVVATMVWGFIIIQRSKNFDKGMKRISYIFLIPVLSILSVIIMRLLGSE